MNSNCPTCDRPGCLERVVAASAAWDAAREQIATLEAERDAARKDCDGFISRYRDDGDRMRHLCGEVWRLGGFSGPEGLAHMALDRGGAVVAALVAERDAAIQRAEAGGGADRRGLRCRGGHRKSPPCWLQHGRHCTRRPGAAAGAHTQGRERNMNGRKMEWRPRLTTLASIVVGQCFTLPENPPERIELFMRCNAAAGITAVLVCGAGAGLLYDLPLDKQVVPVLADVTWAISTTSDMGGKP